MFPPIERGNLGEKSWELEIDFRPRTAVASEACFDDAGLVIFRTLGSEGREGLHRGGAVRDRWPALATIVIWSLLTPTFPFGIF